MGCMRALVSTLQLRQYEKFRYAIRCCCCYRIPTYKLNERKEKENLQTKDQYQPQETQKETKK